MVTMKVKSTIEEIRERFDHDVERFSNLETGQSATVDAALAMDLITETAAAVTPGAKKMLDIGCGAGNFSLKMRQRIPGIAVTLVDLSKPMLDRAAARLGANATTVQRDIRDLEVNALSLDIVLAAAVLHHLRSESEWRAVFNKIYKALSPGGGFWIFDMVDHELAAVHKVMWRRFGEYLSAFKGDEYRDNVFAYIEKEDTPRSLTFQMDMLKQAGFAKIDVLHKNSCFAAFGGIK